jgi:hypothetical protein
MHARYSPVAITGWGTAACQAAVLLGQSEQWRLHYYLLLPQVGGLLLKNYGESQRKGYALFKRRFSKTLSSILSGEGFDEKEQGKSPLAILDHHAHLRASCAPVRPTPFQARNQ